jgi:branched-chain amino acid transport system ATP-binding protein
MNALASTPALSVKGLTKRFGGLCATDAVSFDVAEGSVTTLIGPNGAGKTTLFNLITNVYRADSGSIRFAGTPVTYLPPARIAQLGLVRTFQAARVFPGMTVLENVLAGAHLTVTSHPIAQMLWLRGARAEEKRLLAKANALLDLFGLSAVREAAATDLPMGAQKLLDVIRALMARPRMLLLDEPAAGLNDSETAELGAVLKAVRDAGITVMLVEHNMSLVMGISDQVLVLDAGRLVASGTPDEIRQNAQVIEAYVGHEVEPG